MRQRVTTETRTVRADGTVTVVTGVPVLDGAFVTVQPAPLDVAPVS